MDGQLKEHSWRSLPTHPQPRLTPRKRAVYFYLMVRCFTLPDLSLAANVKPPGKLGVSQRHRTKPILCNRLHPIGPFLCEWPMT